MIVNPMIPIPVMAILCVGLIALKRKGLWPFIRQIVIVILLFLINLRIMVPNDEQEVSVATLHANVYFVVDDTLSMLANDCGDGQTRLDAVYADTDHIIDELVGSKFSVISFHNTAQVLTPLSDDSEFAKSIIHAIHPLDELYAKGTNLDLCRDKLLELLKVNDELGGYNIVFFISDGEDNINDEVASFEEIKDYINAGVVLGYGTEKGGNMYVRSYYDDEESLLETYSYGQGYIPAVSKIDEDRLKKIANDMDVPYVHMTDYSKIDNMIHGWLSEVEVGIDERTQHGYDETYYFFAIALGLMLMAEFFFTVKKLRERKI